MSIVQVTRRGYFWCSVSCLCKACLWSDAWHMHYRYNQDRKDLRDFREPPV